MKPVVKSCYYHSYAYVTTWVDDSMNINNAPENITKLPEATYVFQVIKGLNENSVFYLGAYFVVYDVARLKG